MFLITLIKKTGNYKSVLEKRYGAIITHNSIKHNAIGLLMSIIINCNFKDM